MLKVSPGEGGSFFNADKRKKQVTLVDPTAGQSSSADDRRPTVAAPKMFAFDAIFTEEDSQVSSFRVFEIIRKDDSSSLCPSSFELLERNVATMATVFSAAWEEDSLESREGTRINSGRRGGILGEGNFRRGKREEGKEIETLKTCPSTLAFILETRETSLPGA